MSNNTVVNPNRNNKHKSVMIDEVLTNLNLRKGFTYVDCTFGAGGYSKAILDRIDCKVIGIDKDPETLKDMEALKTNTNEKFIFGIGNFGELDLILRKLDILEIDGGLVLDLGISSMQIEDAVRGFSFMKDGPLDMRMNKLGPTAEDIINSASQSDLCNILRKYGDEKKCNRIAKTIVQDRKNHKIKTTFQLVNIINKVIKRSKNDKKHPATRTFQALRMKVNDEIGELEKVLKLSESILLPGARLVVLSFHSIEDRLVKNFINLKSGNVPNVNRHLPIFSKVSSATFKRISKNIIKVSRDEIRNNIRSRSARLRVAEKISNIKVA